MQVRKVYPGLIRGIGSFVLISLVLVAAHWPLLRLPYYWDEAGYYIPAAHDLFTSGDLIPYSTLTNAHPPLIMAYLALAWRLFGYAPLVTRAAMLLIAALALLGVFVLARYVANRTVALSSALCTGLYPVFFAQSSMAHVDMAAAAFTIWGLFFYLARRRWFCGMAFVLAALSKETAIITPVALYAWEVLRRSDNNSETSFVQRARRAWWLLAPALPLAAWFAFHYARTGYVFGNPQFFRYNIAGTLQPLRVGLVFLRRAWQMLGYMNLYVLTLATAAAMLLPAQCDAGVPRNRIAISNQLVFAVVLGADLLFFSLIGGAPLARYLLPAVPLVVIISVSTIWRRIPGWPAIIALVAAAFIAGLFINPPYVFAPEDNLAYSDYIVLHENAAETIEAQFPRARVLSAWPATDELSKPYLGYVNHPHKVMQLKNFTIEEIQSARQSTDFDIAVVFSSKYEPVHRLPAPKFWQRGEHRFFDYHSDTPPELAAQILGGDLVWKTTRGGQWIAIIAVPQIRNAVLAGSDKVLGL